MKVLLKRNMFLDGILYEPNQAGTDLPDKIGDRKVVLYDHNNPPKPRRKAETIFALDPDQRTLRHVPTDEFVDEKDSKKSLITLPEDVVEWTDKTAKAFAPEGVQLIHGHPKIDEVPLSALTPGLSRQEIKENIKRDEPDLKADKAEEAKEMLDKAAVGKK